MTVIFLPLSFTSSVMSINTIDLRQIATGAMGFLGQLQFDSLFWCYLFAFCVVQDKLKLQRSVCTIMYWPLPYF
jgi:hypothetical protein